VRLADLGRNVPHTLDLGRKKNKQISGGTFRECDLGPKLKIHVFDNFCSINSGSFNPDLGRFFFQPISGPIINRTTRFVLIFAAGLQPHNTGGTGPPTKYAN